MVDRPNDETEQSAGRQRVEVAGREIDPEDDLDYGEDVELPRPCKKVPHGDIYEAARAGDVDRLRLLLEEGVDVNLRDRWDSVPLYYTCLAGHVDAAKMLLEAGAICNEHTFDGDRCHYASLTLRIRRTLKAYELRPPPMDPLPKALREIFDNDFSWTDIVFHVASGKFIKAHRALLSVRSPYFREAFRGKWKDKVEVYLTNNKLTYPALYGLLHFLYCDRLDIAVDDMEDLLRVAKVCKCKSLQEAVQKELEHQTYAEYKVAKSLNDEDNSQRKWILQGSSLPTADRLPAAMHEIFNRVLLGAAAMDKVAGGRNVDIAVKKDERDDSGIMQNLHSRSSEYVSSQDQENKKGRTVECDFDDHADLCLSVGDKLFRCHRTILAARSDYFKALFDRTENFREGRFTVEWDRGKTGSTVPDLPVVPVHDMSPDAFSKVLEYIYTDQIQEVQLGQAEEVFEAASRYLLFPLKRAVADALLPQLEAATPPELCNWLLMADLYGVWRLREYCLDIMATNFETFENTSEFRAMLLTLPPPSGDSSERTTAPSAPGGAAAIGLEQANVLDDLREKWLEIEGAELHERDASALEFDQRLLQLAEMASLEEQEDDNTRS